MGFKENIQSIRHFFSETERGKAVQKYGRRAVILVIVGLIVYQLFDIGWTEVLGSLPDVPLFYVLFVVLFLTLPIAEVFIYRQVWPLKRRHLFRAFLTKKVYNDEVMGYSGEVFLFVWGRKRLNKPEMEVLKNVRDNNILSAITSTSVAFTLVGALVFTGVLNLEDIIGRVDIVYYITAAVIVAVFIALLVQFRQYVFSLPLKSALKVGGIYMSRFLIHNTLLVIQWAIVIPETPLSIWFIFLAIVIVVNRLPFIPSRDLVFLWAGIELSRMLTMATASVAAMLLVSSALKKVTNLVLFLVLSRMDAKEDQLRKEQGEKKLAD
ncbi:MAG: hypothetical protein LAT84_11670 [Balneolia bacterium]|nr:hypothetical protein [Balneolia bacterium]